MLKRLYNIFKPTDDNGVFQVVAEDQHQLSKFDVSRAARKVIDQLKKAGYSAYLVGGGVRDLLLDNDPKDFDVATDATPEQIKAVFSNARIIGKRFRIVHVRFGREIIEVTTFRGTHSDGAGGNESAQTDKGILTRDNVYGDIKSDALRRDFTVNALYYEPNDSAILDYTNGLADLQNRQLRLIGDPDARYKEDPVRMLRAVRFAAKLGFTMTPETEVAIYKHVDYLGEIPAARLFEEVLKLFMSGYATAALNQLKEFGLLAYLFPGTNAALDSGNSYYQKLVFASATNTDKRLRGGKRVTPAFIYAAMLWPPLHQAMKDLVDSQKMSHHDALQLAAQGVVSQQLAHTSIPKRFLIPMREIWSLQLRLTRREGKRAYQLVENPRFRAAYDFLLLREEAGERLDGLGLWWTQFQSADQAGKEALIKSLAPSGNRKPRRRRKPKSAASASDTPAPDGKS